MKVLVDTNVVLDVLLNRKQFFQDSRTIFEFSEKRQIEGCITAVSLTNIFYIVNKAQKNINAIYEFLNELTDVFSIVPVDDTIIIGALTLHWNDFEDAVQFMAAKQESADYIITRNSQDYESSDIPCLSPAEFVSMLESSSI